MTTDKKEEGVINSLMRTYTELETALYKKMHTTDPNPTFNKADAERGITNGILTQAIYSTFSSGAAVSFSHKLILGLQEKYSMLTTSNTTTCPAVADIMITKTGSDMAVLANFIHTYKTHIDKEFTKLLNGRDLSKIFDDKANPGEKKKLMRQVKDMIFDTYIKARKSNVNTGMPTVYHHRIPALFGKAD